MLSLESHRRGDSDKNTKHIIINIKKDCLMLINRMKKKKKKKMFKLTETGFSIHYL